MGDPCFAKVKGWIPYPARISAIKKSGKKLKFRVLFYETNETNEVVGDCVWPVTPDTVKRLVTPKTLKRRYFLPAFDQMRKFHKIEIPSKDDSNQEEWVEKEGGEKEGDEKDGDEEAEKKAEKEIIDGHISSDDEFDLDFYNLKNTAKKLLPKAPIVEPQRSAIDQGETDHVDVVDSSQSAAEAKDGEHADAVGLGDSPADPEKSWTCDDCGEELLGNQAFLNHVIDHAIAEKAAGINNNIHNNLFIQNTAQPSSSEKVKASGALKPKVAKIKAVKTSATKTGVGAAKTGAAKTGAAKAKAAKAKAGKTGGVASQTGGGAAKTEVGAAKIGDAMAGSAKNKASKKGQKKSKPKPVKTKKSKTLRESEMDAMTPSSGSG